MAWAAFSGGGAIPRTSTGRFKLIAPNFFKSPMSTLFVRETLKFCTRVECAPAEPFTDELVFTYLFIFGQIFGFCIFWDIWVLKDPTFFPAKKKAFVKGSAGAH